MGWTWGSLSSALKLSDLIAQLNRRGKTLEGALNTLTTAVSDAGGNAQPIGPGTLIDNVPAATVVSPSGTSFLEPFDDLPIWNVRAGSGVASVVEGGGETGGKVLRAVGYVWQAFPYNLPFDPSKLYRMRCRVRMTVAPTDPAKDNFYCGVEGVGADGVTLVNAQGLNTSSSQHYVVAQAKDMGTVGALGTFAEFTGWFKGHGTYVPNASNALAPSGLHADVRYIRPLFILNYSGGDGTMELDYIAIDVFDEDGQARLYTALDPSGHTLNVGGTPASDVLAQLDQASADAAQAISDAAGAQATADGKVTTFFAASTSAPAAQGVGDLWIVTDQNNSLKRWSGSAWVDVRDAGIAQAISAAADAQSTADSKIVTFFQTTTPAGATVGDLWIDTDDHNHPYRWNGSAWVDARDGTIAIAQAAADAAQTQADSALTAAQDAQASADGKVTTFFQTSAPTAEGVGDLWVDTDDANHLYRWSGSSWVSVKDGGIQQAIDAASLAQSTADGKIVTFYQTTAPTADGVGDLWIDTDDGNRLHRWNGSTWVDARDTTIAQALAAAQNAQAAADGKIQTFYQTAAPASGMGVGDLWIDTDDSNKLYRWSGSAWVLARDAGIAQAITDAAGAQATADGKVTTFYQSGQPTAEGLGDLWVDTDDGTVYRWSGTAWVVLEVGAGSLAVATLDAITANVGKLSAGLLQDKPSAPTAAIRLDAASALPAVSNYIDLAAAGAAPFVKHGLVELRGDGSAVIDGRPPAMLASSVGRNLLDNPDFEVGPVAGAGDLAAGWYVQTNDAPATLVPTWENVPLEAYSGTHAVYVSVVANRSVPASATLHCTLTSRRLVAAKPAQWIGWRMRYTAQQLVATPAGLAPSLKVWARVEYSDGSTWDSPGVSASALAYPHQLLQEAVQVPASGTSGVTVTGVRLWFWVELKNTTGAAISTPNNLMWDVRFDAAELLPLTSLADDTVNGPQFDDDGTVWVPGATTVKVGTRGNPGTLSKDIYIPFTMFRPASNATPWNVDSGYLTPSASTSATGAYRCGLILPNGATITAVSAALFQSTASDAASIDLRRSSQTGAESSLGTASATVIGGWGRVSVASLNEHVLNTVYSLRIALTNAAAAGARAMYVIVSITVPDYGTSL